MVPLALFPILAPKDTQIADTAANSDRARSSSQEVTPFTVQVTLLFKNTEYVLIAFGMNFFIFMAGAVIFWGPTFQEKMFGVDRLEAGLVLGGIVLVTGVFGTITGSLVVDCMSQSALTEFQAGTQSASWLLLARAERSSLFLFVTILCAGVVGVLGVAMTEYSLFVMTLGIALLLTSL